MKVFVAVLALSIISFTARADSLPPSEPANTNANGEARVVLKYFQGLSNAPVKRIVSGQFADFGPWATTRLLGEIARQTGHWPGIIGVDYADFSKGALDTKTPNQAAIEYWRAGGLVSISAHLYDPANPDGGGLRDRGVDLAALLAPEGETHRRWMSELDTLAAGLQELDRAGVVVLWRPFHEMNGGWFWWGGKKPGDFVQLWRQMFNYFTQSKGLNNLLWVYAPNHGRGPARYYPGDRFADLVGLDAYTDFVDPAHIKGYPEMAALPKPFGFTEFGPHGPDHPPGDFDYTRFLSGVENHFPKTCFFLSWNGKWSLAQNSNVQQMLDDPLLVNRANLPKW